MAQELSFRDIQVSSNDIEVRKIGFNDLWQSLKEGYEDFNARPSYSLFLALIYPLFALLLTLLVVGENLVYLAFPIVAGFTVIGPVVSVGLFEMSRRREQGLDLTWRKAFGFVHTHAFAPILALSIMMMLLYVAWLFMAQFIYTGLYGMDPPESISALWNELFTTRRGQGLVMYGFGVGFLFALTALAFSVVAFPLLLDRPASSFTAINTSVRAVFANPVVMGVWGLVVVVLLAAGAAIFLIGLAAVLPILGHATWHLYRKLVVP